MRHEGVGICLVRSSFDNWSSFSKVADTLHVFERP